MVENNTPPNIRSFLDNLLNDWKDTLSYPITFFISSTQRDLSEERNAVKTIIQELGLEVCGMEDFGARPENSLDTCLNELNKSDIYIGIIGMNYGSIYNNEKSGDTEKIGKSYTQIEYEKAISDEKPALIYIISKQNGLVHPEHIDFTNQDKLDDFKSTLQNNHTVYFYSDIQDLCNRVLSDLVHFVPRYLDNKELEYKLSQINTQNTPESKITMDLDKSVYYPVDSIQVRGTLHSDKDKFIYLYMVKPGVSLSDIALIKKDDLCNIGLNNEEYRLTKVDSNGVWNVILPLRQLEINIKNSDVYSLLALPKQLEEGNLDVYAASPVTLRPAFISMTFASETYIRGLPFTVSGIAETVFPAVYIWICSATSFIARDTILLENDGSYKYTIPPHISEKLKENEQYFCLIQMPIRHKDGDIGIIHHDGKDVISRYNTDVDNGINVLPVSREHKNFAVELFDIFNSPDVSDQYIKYSFISVKAKIEITQRKEKDVLTIYGKTNLPAGTKVIFQLKSGGDTKLRPLYTSPYFYFERIINVIEDKNGNGVMYININLKEYPIKNGMIGDFLYYHNRDKICSYEINTK